MADPDSLEYTRREILGLLPGGWQLADSNNPGSWDPGRRIWATRLLDGADMEWPIQVRPTDAGRLGRLAALKQAVDRIYREGLG